MHCLLCHEKIPRLRAWTGKSEFCCDEHADLYKKQTMDRLLVDDSASKSAAPALPIFDVGASSVDHVLLTGQSAKVTQAKGGNETADDVDELWKLAARMGGEEEESSTDVTFPAASNESEGDVRRHSAEDALAALQALAAEAAQAKQHPAADDDLLDEFSSMESSLGEFQLESLPIDLAAAMASDEIDEAPELELDALELPKAADAATPIAASDAIDAPELLLEELAEAREESLEPPELVSEFEAEQAESFEPPVAVSEELPAMSNAFDWQGSELSDPPEPADFDIAATAYEADAGEPAAAPAPRRAPKATPKLRPATELQEMNPSPIVPEGGYALKPWTDALAVAGPDRASLLSPAKFSEMRKSCLNGTASAKFDPVQFLASKRVAAVPVSISEPKGSGVLYDCQGDAIMPSSPFAWPAPFHEAWSAAEMKLSGASESVSLGGAFFSVKQPTLSAEFLGRVALQSRILEPKRSAILSPPERDVLPSASADEEESGGEYASAANRTDSDETDGGERAHVADLF